jgi:hypothetical protein
MYKLMSCLGTKSDMSFIDYTRKVKRIDKFVYNHAVFSFLAHLWRLRMWNFAERVIYKHNDDALVLTFITVPKFLSHPALNTHSLQDLSTEWLSLIYLTFAVLQFSM